MMEASVASGNQAKAPHIVRVPLTMPKEDDHPFIMMQVKPTGKLPLDLRLLGTDNTDVFHAQLRQNRITQFKAPGSSVSDDDWQNALLTLLLGRPQPGEMMSAMGVDAEATIDDHKISIHIRKLVHGISTRLGTLTLEKNSELGVDVFGWCGLLAESRAAVQKQLDEKLAQTTRLELSLAQLQQQLDEFITCKPRDDMVLMDRFRELLNEKKARIREQHQQLIALQPESDPGHRTTHSLLHRGIQGATTSPEPQLKHEPLESDDDLANKPPAYAPASRKAPTRTTKAGAASSLSPSRRTTRSASKRKISQAESAVLSESSQGGGAKDDNATASETSDIDVDDARMINTDSRPHSPDDGDGDGDDNHNIGETVALKRVSAPVTAMQAVDMDLADMPPPRALPFVRNATVQAEKNQVADHDDEETTSGDEL